MLLGEILKICKTDSTQDTKDPVTSSLYSINADLR